MENAGKLRQIPVDQIIEDGNIRADYADIEELAASIEAVGQLEPVLVKPLGKNNDTGLEEYELIAGFRRRRAILHLKNKGQGFTMIDAVVVTGDKLTLQLVENLQRSDLTHTEQETGISQLVKMVGSNKEAAARLSKHEHFIYRNLAAFRVRDALKKAGVDASAVSTSVLCEIHAIPAKDLRELGEKLVAGGGTLACARQLMRDYNAGKKAPPNEPQKSDYEPAPDVSVADDDVPVDGEAVDAAPLKPEAKAQSVKKTSVKPPARALEEPPHKTVDLNSVQVVIQKYIEKVNKNEDGYGVEYKTDAAYEIWSLLLSELAES
jgi:ParB/RepB/Spo0J family partition protein